MAARAARLGQHFLKSEKVLKEIAGMLKITPEDIVLEIGAGDGRLTKHLISARKVIAVEIDKKLIEKLNKLDFSNLHIVGSDILEFEIPSNVTKIVGNLPYKISSPLTEKIIMFLNKHQSKNPVAVLMYQKEFAERMVSSPGKRSWSRLSIMVDYYSNCSIVKNISRTMFNPPPKVNSSVVKITSKRVEENKLLQKTARILFTHKNKKVINAIIDSRNFLKTTDKKKLKEILPEMLGDLGEKKVFCLSTDEIIKIQEKIKKII